ncbi:unnamed protein product [marine sediment metagenome]|uniref:Uncharacterized protein n=1 Tax=marine sediment metagenome TaxID=412755 RepID=X1NK84_9ZZZZ
MVKKLEKSGMEKATFCDLILASSIMALIALETSLVESKRVLFSNVLNGFL